MKGSKLKRDFAAEVPGGMQVQLARLFGAESSNAKMKSRTSTQWKKTLRLILQELSRYLEANVETDDVHLPMLYSGLAGAYESLKDNDFWPGYVEGITRLALIQSRNLHNHPVDDPTSSAPTKFSSRFASLFARDTAPERCVGLVWNFAGPVVSEGG